MTLRAQDFWKRVTPEALSEGEYQALVEQHKAKFGEHWEAALEVTLAARNQPPAAANGDLWEGVAFDPSERRRQQIGRFCEHYNRHEYERIHGHNRQQRPPAQPRHRANDYWAKVSPVQTAPRDFPS